MANAAVSHHAHALTDGVSHVHGKRKKGSKEKFAYASFSIALSRSGIGLTSTSPVSTAVQQFA
jgi:hypothetical protein